MVGATYFFTVVTHHRRLLFSNPQHRRWLGASFCAARRALPFDIDAIVLLPDHLHVVLRPLEGVDYSTLWRRIKTSFTRHVLQSRSVAEFQSDRARRKGEGDIWQRRFYEHTIRDEDDWGRHVDYIHWNPVKHGLVRRPQDWRWSSIHRYVARGLLVPGWPDGQEIEFPNVQE